MPSAALYEAVYRSQPEEHAFRVTKVEGTIPGDLSGTFLRSGPGVMQLGEDVMSFFDGHAMIAGVSFEGGAATFRSRLVRTPLFAEETAKQRMTKRRIFSNLPSRWSNLFALELGNGAMHDVYAWGDGDAHRVVAGNDPGHFALDPRTLATTHAEDWGGAVTKGHEMSPMPYRDPHTDRLVGWIKKVGGARPDALRFVELDGAFRVVKETQSLPLAASPAIVHDHRATKRWYVAVEQSVRLSVPSAIWGAKTVYESMATPSGATATLLLVSRDAGDRLVRIPLPQPVQFAFHVINAFDDGDRVVVDLVTYDGRINFESSGAEAFRRRMGVTPKHGPRPMPMRVVVDPGRACVVASNTLGTTPGETPEVRDDLMGSAYRYAYFTAPHADDANPDRGAFVYFGAVAKVDVESGQAETWTAPSSLVSPCAFVPRAGASNEDDGYLLTYLLREAGTGLAILDASAPSKGPIATLDLGVTLPGVSHTRWASGLHLDA